MNAKEGIECEGYLCAKTRTVSQLWRSAQLRLWHHLFSFSSSSSGNSVRTVEFRQALPGTAKAKVSALVASFEHLAGTWSNCPI